MIRETFDAAIRCGQTALLRGESVDWQPGEEGWRRRLQQQREREGSAP